MTIGYKKSVVVIGGGTGAFTILRGLKQYSDWIDITAIISMADSGGSTGRLRDEFGQLPVGDVRMALTALARDYEAHEGLLRELFLYRFEKGNGLSGHNFGNLMLTALTDILGSEAAAVEAASKILRISGRVLPVTSESVHLVATYDDGTVVVGEHQIDDPKSDRQGHRITTLATDVPATISPAARAALLEANLIIIGPGDLYSSLLANLVIKGVPEAMAEAAAPVAYVANLMERFGQTEGMSVADCVAEIKRYATVAPQYVLINNRPLAPEALALYEQSEGVGPVFDDSASLAATVIKTDLLAEERVAQHKADAVKRSLIRHDSDKLARTIMHLLE